LTFLNQHIHLKEKCIFCMVQSMVSVNFPRKDGALPQQGKCVSQVEKRMKARNFWSKLGF
jgi:hypothetical protein